MVILGPTTSAVHLSLNEYNGNYGIGTNKGLNIVNYHYIFRLTNKLTDWSTTFTPYTSALYQGGDRWWNSFTGIRQSEFLFTVSPTYSNSQSAVILMTGSNYDNGGQFNLEVFVDTGSASVGTPSIATSSILLNTYRTIFKY